MRMILCGQTAMYFPFLFTKDTFPWKPCAMKLTASVRC